MRSASRPSGSPRHDRGNTEAPTFKISLDPETIDAIAAAIAERCYSPEGEPDRWMTSSEAAAYLAIPYSTFRKLTAAGRIVGEQDTVGGRFYFRRSYLDSWRSRPPE